ncbi:M20 family metallo-hydrolase [Kaistella faecalis]|uniref:M20 family metallo-hydrolase n=1 Tax=Kaistella faecalis TaxID=2852098 RepID=UPI001C44C564|nr:M20 family metallo-hydrolase [Chryseobacterium faecale]UFK97535.1 M20 family metallo-hydrolase [Chryseobacterium faecale]
MEILNNEVRNFLIELIETPSFSKEEENTALIIEKYLNLKNIPFQRKGNNIWAKNLYFDENLPTILLNSHHDTVKPNSGYTLDPFKAVKKDGKIFGLGSNDAGASLVSLWAVFAHFYAKKLKYNLIYAATAEEEISGENGVKSILEDLGKINFAIVGEPTKMDLAVAEKGLVVLNCVAKGTASHAAHINDDNSIYKAVRDIQKVQNFEFDKISEVLGKVKATVTIVNAGSQHNVVPDQCHFTIDVRTNEHYSNSEIVEIFKKELESEIQPRSLALNSSKINLDHPFVLAAQQENCNLYGSPTVSDQALMPFDSVKIGPGDSMRSHTADEFIYEKELAEGIEKYIEILSHIL